MKFIYISSNNWKVEILKANKNVISDLSHYYKSDPDDLFNTKLNI